jgi:hypothetical protein
MQDGKGLGSSIDACRSAALGIYRAMKRVVRSWRLTLPVFVAALFLLVPATSTKAGIVLSSNMNVGATGSTDISNTQWIAAPFRSTSVLTRLTDVSIDVFDNGQYAGGDLSVEIWTASNAGPTAFMQSIRKSSFSSTPVAITGLSLNLQPNTNYAVVARGNSFNAYSDPMMGSIPGSLSWNEVNTTTHTGDGFVSGSWSSPNSGSSWISFSSSTLKMSVFASSSAVPEIDPATGGSALSLITGVLAMIEQRHRRATRVA